MDKKDWHPADIIAAVRKKNTTLSALSRKHGLSSTTLNNALRHSWTKGENIIAEALGIPAWEIWPTRYFNSDGTPKPRTTKELHK